jgi:hypothetical protein
MLSDPGKAIARVLEIPAKSSMDLAIRVAVAFALSGVLHAVTLPRDMPEVSPLRYAVFFWIQGLCVLLEIFASRCVSKVERVTGRRPLWVENCLMVVRVGWTVLVLYNTVPLIEGELVKVSLRMGDRPVILFPSPR